MIVRLWLDHPKFGCGMRHYIALPGRKWVKLVEISTGAAGKITLEEFQKANTAAFVDDAFRSPKRVKKRLKANAEAFGNHGAVLKEALASLVSKKRERADGLDDPDSLAEGGD